MISDTLKERGSIKLADFQSSVRCSIDMAAEQNIITFMVSVSAIFAISRLITKIQNELV